ncbi:hypothetical protein WR25_14195 [Diploscapter pachys]|uniref:Methyltransferase domain-containing protein n=1 Tax=Diploscapter pachys TaxID=2018661 RepID=A0A2A2LZ09_9BILA|nr:hypothetical protein WR25_14195 [Diploscapter pachys]
MENNSQYARKDYWDERFKTETNFEWIASFDAFQALILPLLKPEFRILHIGCGSSDLSVRLYEMGFENITNVDYSEVLINSMKLSHPEMTWVVDDIRSLSSLDPESYDVVIEKATIEALLVNEKSPWCPSDEALKMLDSVFDAAQRVLRPNATFSGSCFAKIRKLGSRGSRVR